MCLIIYAPKGKDFPLDKIHNAYDTNDKGVGIMYVSDGRVVVEKRAFPKWEDVEQLWKKRPDYRQFVMHLRFITYGDQSETNTHPYQILNKDEHGVDLWMMHNGSISWAAGDDKAKSDTWYLANRILRPQLRTHPKLLHDPLFQAGVSRMIGMGSKLLFLDSNGRVVIINEKEGATQHDCWISNTYSVTGNHYRANRNNNNHVVNRGWESEMRAYGEYDRCGIPWARAASGLHVPAHSKEEAVAKGILKTGDTLSVAEATALRILYQHSRVPEGFIEMWPACKKLLDSKLISVIKMVDKGEGYRLVTLTSASVEYMRNYYKQPNMFGTHTTELRGINGFTFAIAPKDLPSVAPKEVERVDPFDKRGPPLSQEEFNLLCHVANDSVEGSSTCSAAIFSDEEIAHCIAAGLLEFDTYIPDAGENKNQVLVVPILTIRGMLAIGVMPNGMPAEYDLQWPFGMEGDYNSGMPMWREGAAIPTYPVIALKYMHNGAGNPFLISSAGTIVRFPSIMNYLESRNARD